MTLPRPELQHRAEAALADEAGVEPPGGDVAGHVGAAAVGDVLHPHPGHGLHQLPHEVADMGDAGGAEGDLAGPPLRLGQEAAQVAGREARAHAQHIGRAGELGDRQQQVVVERQRLVHQWGSDRRRSLHDQRVAIGRRLRRGGGADRAGGAGAVLDHQLLAEVLPGPGLHDPGDGIGDAAGAVGADQPHRAVGEVADALGADPLRQGRHRQQRRPEQRPPPHRGRSSPKSHQMPAISPSPSRSSGASACSSGPCWLQPG